MEESDLLSESKTSFKIMVYVMIVLCSGEYKAVCLNCTDLVDQIYNLQALLRMKILELKEKVKSTIRYKGRFRVDHSVFYTPPVGFRVGHEYQVLIALNLEKILAQTSFFSSNYILKDTF